MESKLKWQQECVDAIAREDAVKLRELAGDVGDSCAVSQDPDLIRLSIVCYLFHKIFIKMHLRGKYDSLSRISMEAIGKRDYESAIDAVAQFDRHHGFFEGGLVWKARIKMSARLHSRGLSLTRAAALTGAKVSDLAEYVGETREYHTHKEGMPLSMRLNITRDIFKHI